MKRQGNGRRSVKNTVGGVVTRQRCYCLYLPRLIGFAGIIELHIWTFFAFFEAVAPSLSLKFYVTNEFKMAERLSVKIVTFSRFFAFFLQKIPKREKVQSTLD